MHKPTLIHSRFLIYCITFAISTYTHAYAQVTTSATKIVDDPIVAAMDSLYRLDLFKVSAKQNTYSDKRKRPLPVDSVPRFKPEVYAKRLALLDAATPFDLRYNENVQNYIDLYVIRRRDVVSRVMGLSHYYFPLFEEALAKYNLPLELKYLAICESALNPVARSKAGAAGLWQFMYPTGKMFGLKVNSYIDERHDPYKATIAACKYFEYLYKMYHNWELVLAAYNAGPGNVNRAIRRSGGKKTYWEIRPYLPEETRGYIPAFIAVNYMMNYTVEHNLYSLEIKNYFSQTDTVSLEQQLSFYQISKLVNIPEDELQNLNPCYTKRVIPILPGYTSVLTLPADKMGLFVSNEAKIYDNAKSDSIPAAVVSVSQDVIKIHKVKKGENLGSIAKKNGCTVAQLKAWNNKRTSDVYVGERLRIQEKSYENRPTTESKTATASKTSTSSTAGGGYKYHIVKSGQTLSSIASKYSTTVTQLQKLNKLTSKSVLHPGQKLKVRAL
jgi:membrane-bound lytic murein transglycosylase D